MRLRPIRGISSRATPLPTSGTGWAGGRTGTVVVVGVAGSVGTVLSLVVGSVVGGAVVVVVGCRLGPGNLLVELGGQRALGLRGLDAGAPQLVGDEGEHQQPERDQGATDPTDDPSPVVRRLGTIPVADLLVTGGWFLGHGVIDSNGALG